MSIIIPFFQLQFNELVAADCALCGKMAIKNVACLYFSDAKAYENEQKIWLLT